MATDTANPLAAGDTAELYRAAIGPRGQDYYLRQFARFDTAGKTGASWHWAAYWSTLNWLVYRKMWGQALAYVAAVLGMALLIFGVGKLLLNYDSTTGLALFLLFLTAAFVVPGLYANAWYYNFCNEKISAALRETQDVQQACERLSTQASSNRRFAGQAAVNVALLALLAGLVTFLLDPAQQMMQLAQSGAPQPAMPVLAPANGAPVTTPPAEPATAPTAAPAATPAATEVVKAETPPEAPTKPADTATAPAVEPAPRPEGPVLTSAAQIDDYLARTSGVPREPAVDKPNGAPDAVVQTAQAQPARPVRPAAMQVAAAASDTPAKPAQPARNGKSKTETAKTADVAAGASSPGAEAPAPAVAGKPKRTPSKKSWYVQAGAFAQESNAQNVRLRIEAAGLETSTAPYETQAGRLIRVRVGPFAAKADAEKAALQVKALDLPAVLFRE